MSDHQLIFCRPQFFKFKSGGVHKYINFHSLKSYRVNDYEKGPGQIVLPSYEIFDDVDAVYSDFLQKIITVIANISPLKTKRVKGNNQEWFNVEVLEKLNSRDKLFQEFKNSRLHIYKELFIKAKYEALKPTAAKEQVFFKKKSQKLFVNQKSYGNSLNI